MGLLSSLKRIFSGEENSQSVVEQEPSKVEEVALEISEEDRLVVALAASVMAGKDKPNSHYHISSIRRVR